MSDRTLVGYGRLLEAVETEGELLASSAIGTNPDAEVPGCPGLALGETVRHVGSLYRMVLSWLRAGERPTSWQREPDLGQPVEEYLLAGLRAVVDHLGAHDPEDPCSTWWPEHQAYGFWYRRLAHETTVHRMDVQGAAHIGLDGVADDIALDGIDEILSLWFVHRLTVMRVSGTRHGRVRVRTGGREWIARSTPAGTSAWRVEDSNETTEPAVPDDAVVFADPMSTYRWMWGRLSPHRGVEREGSDDAVAQLWALLRLATK